MKPPALAVMSAYPNPFNAVTTIEFSLPGAGRAELTVCSVTGQKVRELFSVVMAAGVYSLIWDGRDDSGRTVSSGVYIARLDSGNHLNTGKLLLMK